MRVLQSVCLPTVSSVLVLVIASLAPAEDRYQHDIQPFMNRFCIECHNSKKAKGKLDLTIYSKEQDIIDRFRNWQAIVEFIENAEMPPESYKQQPDLNEREGVLDAIDKVMVRAASANAGDPGIIAARRLSNTEYNQTVSALIGHTVRPTATFPVDSAGGEGFDNTSDSLDLTPGLFKKYLSAAESLADHLILTPAGIEFSPHPVATRPERTRFAEKPILDFYRRHTPTIKPYVHAAYAYQAQKARKTVADIADANGLSASYLKTVYDALNNAERTGGYFRAIAKHWQSVQQASDEKTRKTQIGKLVTYIQQLRWQQFRSQRQYEDQLFDWYTKGFTGWVVKQLERRRDLAARRQAIDERLLTEYSLVIDRSKSGIKKPRNKLGEDKVFHLLIHIGDGGDGADGDYVLLDKPMVTALSDRKKGKLFQKAKELSLREFLARVAPDTLQKLPFGKHPKGHAIDPDSVVFKAPTRVDIRIGKEAINQVHSMRLDAHFTLDPEHGAVGSVDIRAEFCGKRTDAAATIISGAKSKQLAAIRKSAELFCAVFPKTYAYVHPIKKLTAGFHLVDGYFRDDQPLMDMVLTKSQAEELDAMWNRLFYVTNHAELVLRGFLWFERNERFKLGGPDWEFLRIADPKLVEDPLLQQVEDTYLKKVAGSDNVKALFQELRDGLKWQAEMDEIAEQQAISQLPELVRRAYRRLPTSEEMAEIEGLYKQLRSNDGASAEVAMRGVFMALLSSPQFLILDWAPSATGVAKLSESKLANRLSYFLWSAQPDAVLEEAVAAGKLATDADLVMAMTRMTRDARIVNFARECFGQWLRYRDFEGKNPAEKGVPGYTKALHDSMFEEPTRFITYLIQNDRPVTEILNSDDTIVNGSLAVHYGGKVLAQYLAKEANSKNIEFFRRKAQGRKYNVDKVAVYDRIWHRVSGLQKQGRGGLASMPVILAVNTVGTRTSPIKRGYWVVHYLLGQHFPPPPANVGDLPSSDKKAKVTMRELLEQHSKDPSCAVCHTRFDSIGLAAENFGITGKFRTTDGAGRSISSSVNLPDGTAVSGMHQVAQYLDQQRRDEFIKTLCKKVLGYALGRSIELSDRALLEKMEKDLHENEYRFSALFASIITSQQFRHVRGLTKR